MSAGTLADLAILFGEICQLMDQCCLSMLFQLQNAAVPEVLHDVMYIIL